jgi:hypothetical protein
LSGGERGDPAVKPVGVTLDYAPVVRRRPVQWRRIARRVLRYTIVTLAVALPVSAAYVSYRWPWAWYGSRERFELHRMRTFRLPPDQVVFEEDPERATQLVLRPPDPAMRSSYRADRNLLSDYKRARGSWPAVIFRPEFFRQPGYMPLDNALVFMHVRTGPTGVRRAVWVEAGRWRNVNATPGVYLLVHWHECDWPFSRYDSDKRCMYRGLTLPAVAVAEVRLFAGQPDADDAGRFTIRYEIDDVPGTIEGRLGADNTVMMRVLDGPAVASPHVGMWGPGHAK